MFRKKFGLIALLLCIVLIVGYFAVNTGAVSTVLLAIQGAITDGNLVKFSGTNGIGVDTGLSASNVTKNRFDATSAPTINDDVDLGYTVGSRWVDVTNDKEYICLDNADGAAVWTETTGAGGGATTFTALTDTPANYTDQAGKYVKVNTGETALEFGTPAGGGTYLELTDTPAAYDNGKYAKSTADGVIWDDPAGAGDMTKAVYDNDADDIVDKAETVDDGIGNSSTAADVKNAVTKKHTQNTDTQFDFYNALAEDHTWSGDKDTQPVGENVVFGDILYFNWTDKEWKKAIASAYATARGTRIALESKADGETCLMLVKGYIRDDSAFDFGAVPIFLNDDTAGTCDDTAPEESGDQIFMVGEAKSADILFFNPGQDVGEI